MRGRSCELLLDVSASPFGINFGAVFSSCTGAFGLFDLEPLDPVGVTDLDLLPEDDREPGLRRRIITGVAYIGGGGGIPGRGGGIIYGIGWNLGGGGEKNLGRTSGGGGGGLVNIGLGGGGPLRMNTGGGGVGPANTGLIMDLGRGGTTVGSVVAAVGDCRGSGSTTYLDMLYFFTSVLSLL